MGGAAGFKWFLPQESLGRSPTPHHPGFLRASRSLLYAEGQEGGQNKGRWLGQAPETQTSSLPPTTVPRASRGAPGGGHPPILIKAPQPLSRTTHRATHSLRTFPKVNPETSPWRPAVSSLRPCCPYTCIVAPSTHCGFAASSLGSSVNVGRPQTLALTTLTV